MKKDWQINLWEKLKERREKTLKENKILNKNYKKLSLVEKNAYEEILKRKSSNWGGFYLTGLAIKIIIFMFVFIAGAIYFYGNGLVGFKELAEPVFRLSLKIIGYAIIVDIGLIILSDFINISQLGKLKRKLLLNG